jgi:hypothetical protein
MILFVITLTYRGFLSFCGFTKEGGNALDSEQKRFGFYVCGIQKAY